MTEDDPTPREEQIRRDLEPNGFTIDDIDESGAAPIISGYFEGTEKQARNAIPDGYQEETLMHTAEGTMVRLSVK